jgi:hypothetical protein
MVRRVWTALAFVLLFCSIGTTGALAQSTSAASDALPIFDAHIHYSIDAWELFDVDAAIAQLDRANIRVALVSSTPDDGTLKLHARAPDRIIPILRPYRTRSDISTWTQDPSIPLYLRARLEGAAPNLRYRGIGEFHLYGGEATRPVVGEVVALARQYDLFLHAHADLGTVEELLSEHSDVRVLWAHAGMSASPAAIARLLDRHGRRVWVELALRYDVAPGGVLDAEWAQLFARYPGRLMMGTDTWIPSQWTRLPDLMANAQTWLRQLPPALADAIAWRNAACLFGHEGSAIPRPSDCSSD